MSGINVPTLAFHGAAAVGNTIYCAGWMTPFMGKFDTAVNTFSTQACGADCSGIGGSRFDTAVAYDTAVFFVPHRNDAIEMLDTRSGTVDSTQDDQIKTTFRYSGANMWGFKIYFSPKRWMQVGIIDIPACSNITPNIGTMVPAFALSTTVYRIDVHTAQANISLTCDTYFGSSPVILTQSSTSVTHSTTSGVASGLFHLNFGLNPLIVAVTSPDGVENKTVSVTVNRPSNDASLYALTPTPGAFVETFAPNTLAPVTQEAHYFDNANPLWGDATSSGWLSETE